MASNFEAQLSLRWAQDGRPFWLWEEQKAQIMKTRLWMLASIIAFTFLFAAEATAGKEIMRQPQSAGDGRSETGNLKGTTRVTVTGDATVQAEPDTAIVNIAVVTQNQSASEAQAENASRSERVMRAVKAAAETNAEVKTSGYSLQPQRVYKENQPPTISGCEALNTVDSHDERCSRET